MAVRNRPSAALPLSLLALLCAMFALSMANPAHAKVPVPERVAEAEAERIAAIERATHASIAIFDIAGQGGGSGVIISPEGYAITNFHVVQPCGSHMRCGLSDGILYEAVIVSSDPVGDVALIKLLGRDDFPTATWGDSDLVRQGDWCFAIGNPFLLATDFQLSVSYGIISGTHRYQYPENTLLEYTDCIQTDAAINPGNSGGPLYNAQGELIGINGRCSFEKRGRVNVGVGYAISINQIKNFLGYLHSGRIVDHATLGATVFTNQEGKVQINNILSSSDAYRRGIRSGDEIVSFGGRPISTVNGFKNVLGIYPRGWRIPIGYIDREGERHTTLVRLAGVHTRSELVELIQGEAPPSEEAENFNFPLQQREIGGETVGVEEVENAPDTPELPFYEGRRGFVNYYFNRQEQMRIWNAFTNGRAMEAAPAVWRMQGTMLGKEVELFLSEEEASMLHAERKTEIDFSESLHDQTGPTGSGGLLLALMMWQRLVTLGPEQFGDLYYMGAAPLAGYEGLADVLVGTYDSLECWFYFDPEEGTLLAMEMFPDTGVDPCEIYFRNYTEEEGLPFPTQMQMLFGDAEDITIEWAPLNIDSGQE